ncbi:MAG: hypothetical protein MAG551_00834 [Candidatus Scalindua arabica]|uniref:Uncharacterized protein n=1 Tax=Candidatus Scalindua arabica TaxID=1127984 RepID=A0A941W171_9BACT|nr:hypothetical protein [Candidatus Scalindua arabica]
MDVHHLFRLKDIVGQVPSVRIITDGIDTNYPRTKSAEGKEKARIGTDVYLMCSISPKLGEGTFKTGNNVPCYRLFAF